MPIQNIVAEITTLGTINSGKLKIGTIAKSFKKLPFSRTYSVLIEDANIVVSTSINAVVGTSYKLTLTIEDKSSPFFDDTRITDTDPFSRTDIVQVT